MSHDRFLDLVNLCLDGFRLTAVEGKEEVAIVSFSSAAGEDHRHCALKIVEFRKKAKQVQAVGISK